MDIKTLGVEESIKRLIPFSVISITQNKRRKPQLQKITDKDVELKTPSIIFKCSRKHIAFGEFELKVLDVILEIWIKLNMITPTEKKEVVLKLINNYAFISGFEDIVIARYLRGSDKLAFRTHLSVLKILSELALQNYEGQNCTSGFVYINDWKETREYNNFTFHKFQQTLDMPFDIFSQPASYRYVDGKNTFYLLTAYWKVVGILVLKEPKKLSFTERVLGEQFQEFYDSDKNWVAYVGNTRNVKIHLNSDNTFYWEKKHWKAVDYTILRTIVKNYGLSDELINYLLSTLIALSEKREGTVVLLAEDSNRLPKTSGNIDDTDIKEILQGILKQESLESLSNTNRLEKVLSSDGLTTFNKDGKILETGQIIDLADEISRGIDKNIIGGGRTQAARVASNYGLAIKVSEDGPISFFRKGEKIFEV